MKTLRFLARAAVLGLLAAATAASSARAAEVRVDLRAPHNGDRVGRGGFGWLIDLAVRFDVPVEQTGLTAPQLTGPGVHASAPPLPGTFGIGADDRFRGLVVLVATTAPGARSCQNIANLFNLTGISDATERTTEILDTWIVGAPNFGRDVATTTWVAIAADRDGNGVYDDAPDVVPDADGDGSCDERDLRAFGVASNVARAEFVVNP
jgi:hypothetical protein